MSLCARNAITTARGRVAAHAKVAARTARRAIPALASTQTRIALSPVGGNNLSGVQRRGFAAVVEKEPEYGNVTGYSLFQSKDPFRLKTGADLPQLEIAYEQWGDLNARRDNVILLQCGMSASSHAASNTRNAAKGWWEEYIGPGKPLDTNLFQIICTNNLGGCYGSSGPSSKHPVDGKPYGSRFPRFLVQDQVAAQFELLDYLGIKKVHACVGASLGGMQSVCAAVMFPDRVGKFVSISAAAKSFPGSMAFRHAQRRAIMSDPNWNGGDYYDGKLPAAGLRLAREIGTITYRSGKEWQMRFGQKRSEPGLPGAGLAPEFMIENYLSHQGGKWVNNYDPNSMLWISKAMDSFSMEKPDAEGNPCLTAGLSAAKQPALVIGVQHDVLFPVWQQKQIADCLRAAGNKSVAYYELDSVYGHDAFLLDKACIGPAVKGHLEQEPGGAMMLWQDQADTTSRVLRSLLARGSSADAMRDMFRAMSGKEEVVEVHALHRVCKNAFEGRVKAEKIDSIFLNKDLPQMITMDTWKGIWQAIEESEREVYLP